MRPTLPLLALAALTAGCARKIEASDLAESDLQRTLFADADFEGADDDVLDDLVAQILQLDGVIRQYADLEPDDRAFGIDPLTEADIGDLPLVPETNLPDQTPTLTYYQSRHPLSAHLQIMADTNQNCLGSNSTKWSNRTFTSGEDCFFDGSCQHATSTGSSRTENPLAKVWIDSFSDYHRLTVEFEDGERDVVLSRGWIDQIWYGDGGGAEWRQRYVLDTLIDAGDGTTLRAYAFWSEAKIPLVGTDLYVATVKDGVEENMENVDLFLDGEVCEDRDKTRADWE